MRYINPYFTYLHPVYLQVITGFRYCVQVYSSLDGRADHIVLGMVTEAVEAGTIKRIDIRIVFFYAGNNCQKLHACSQRPRIVRCLDEMTTANRIFFIISFLV